MKMSGYPEIIYSILAFFLIITTIFTVGFAWAVLTKKKPLE